LGVLLHSLPWGMRMDVDGEYPVLHADSNAMHRLARSRVRFTVIPPELPGLNRARQPPTGRPGRIGIASKGQPI
jgi:hypothetical protein